MDQRTTPLRMSSKQNKLVSRDISDSLGKLPPQATELEIAILGAILLESKAAALVIDFLEVDHFYKEVHREIYSAIVELYKNGDPIDMLIVVNQLKKAGKLEVIGGRLYIAEITANVSSAANIEHHARVVMEMAIKRDLIQLAANIQTDAYEDTSDALLMIDALIEDATRIRVSKERAAASAYISPDTDNIRQEYAEGTVRGTTTYIKPLDRVFRWTRSTISAWYGWAGDGKGEMYRFLNVVRAMNEPGFKAVWCVPEDMNTKRRNKVIRPSADDMYRKIAWTYIGKPTFTKTKYGEAAPLEEVLEAVEWAKKHFIIIDVRGDNISDVIEAARLQKKKDDAIQRTLIDPWTAYEIENRGRGDYTLRYALKYCKRFAEEYDMGVDIITHPKTQVDVRQKKDGPFKVVDQWLVAGGSAWDWACDLQVSIHQPERHLNNGSSAVHFHNLKTKSAELVGCEQRSVCEYIRFDRKTKRYLFSNQDPIGGGVYEDRPQSALEFAPKYDKAVDPDSIDVPF